MGWTSRDVDNYFCEQNSSREGGAFLYQAELLQKIACLTNKAWKSNCESPGEKSHLWESLYWKSCSVLIEEVCDMSHHG